MDQLRHHYIKALGIVEYVPRGCADAVSERETSDPKPDVVQKVALDSLSEGELSTAEQLPKSGVVDPADIVIRESAADIAAVAIEFKLVLGSPVMDC